MWAISKPLADLRANFLNKLNPVEAQKKQLRKIITLGQSCKFATQHGLKPNMTVEDYQASVPLRGYDEFWTEYMAKDFPVLTDLIWPGTFNYFSWSSGTTTGKRKYIPFNSLLAKNYTWAGLDLLTFHFINHPGSWLFSGKTLILGAAESFQELAPGIFLGEVSGLITSRLIFPFNLYKFPPKHVARITDWYERINKVAELVKTTNITGLGGMPSWLLVFFQKLGLEEDRGFWKKIFPNLCFFVHGGVNFNIYLKRFQNFAEGLRVDFREVYPASEGFIAVADRGFNEGLRLLVDHNIFFEFVPVQELYSKNPKRFWVKNIEPNVEYAVIITNPAGLWSYVLGDTVKFLDLNPPRLLITGRTRQNLSVFGEHLIQEELEKALSEAASAFETSIADWVVFGVLEEQNNNIGYHHFVIETSSEVDAEKLAVLIDKTLQNLNDDYFEHRQQGCGLGPPKVTLVYKGFFEKWMKAQGRVGDQYKVPRVISFEKGKELLEFARL